MYKNYVNKNHLYSIYSEVQIKLLNNWQLLYCNVFMRIQCDRMLDHA